MESNDLAEELFSNDLGNGWDDLPGITDAVVITRVELERIREEASDSRQAGKSPAKWLTPSELNHIEGLTFPKRRLEWLGGRLAAKHAAFKVLARANAESIPAWQSLRVENLESGQPVLLDTRGTLRLLPAISISHSSGWAVAMASMEKPCGIDIQAISAQTVRVKERFCSSQEMVVLFGAAPLKGEDEKGLTLLWAAKEAVRKAVGREVLPGFLAIQLLKIQSLPDGKWHLYFSLPKERPGGPEKQRVAVGAVLLGTHALAFTVCETRDRKGRLS